MKEFSPSGIQLILGIRAAFGGGDFRPRLVIERPELRPIVHTLVGRRAGVVKRLGIWLREHDGSTVGELKLVGEHSPGKGWWVYAVEHPDDAELQTNDQLFSDVTDIALAQAAKIEAKPTLLGQVKAGERVRIQIERNISKSEEAVQRAEDRARERAERREERKAQRAAERASEEWGVLLKGRTKFMPQVLALLKEPFYNVQLIDGKYIVPCSKERAGEIAAKLHQLVRTVPRASAMAVVVRIGETEAQKQARHDATKRARLAEKRNRPARPMLDEDCATERAAQWTAMGIDSRPGAPGFPGRVCPQLMPRRDWFNPW